MKTKPKKLSVFELVLFAVFASLMFLSRVIMQFLPNIHMLAFFIVLLTVVYRTKALIPLYIYVLLEGLFSGFALWWIPYTYIWTILWAVAMLIPQDIQKKYAVIVYPLICCAHGLLFGILYSPVQMLMFNLNFNQTVLWIASGFPFDLLQGIGNLIFGLLIYPMKTLLIKLNNKYTK